MGSKFCTAVAPVSSTLLFVERESPGAPLVTPLLPAMFLAVIAEVASMYSTVLVSLIVFEVFASKLLNCPSVLVHVYNTTRHAHVPQRHHYGIMSVSHVASGRSRYLPTNILSPAVATYVYGRGFRQSQKQIHLM
jgi:hypothetical protein